MAESGVEAAMQLWRGVDHAYHKSAPALPEGQEPKRSSKAGGMAFAVAGRRNRERFGAAVELSPSANRDAIAAVGQVFQRGSVRTPAAGQRWERRNFELKAIAEAHLTERWQFLNLVPQHMMPPVPRKTTRGRVQLAEDGRNIAEYLEEIRSLSQPAFDGILEAMRFVVPYMREVRAEPASVVEKTLYLSLTEPGLLQHKGLASVPPERAKIPGWMMSIGTLRALALIAALRHPEPPTLLVVEEIENSLDPRTLGLVVDEIRRAVRAGRTQVIVTTHSPQLLDMVLLKHLVFVQRNSAGEPVFWRPADQSDVKKWAESFSPGQMFTRGFFRQLA
jgi:AAA domain, putative AbiEii toxin, Type IV TA system